MPSGGVHREIEKYGADEESFSVITLVVIGNDNGVSIGAATMVSALRHVGYMPLGVHHSPFPIYIFDRGIM